MSAILSALAQIPGCAPAHTGPAAKASKSSKSSVAEPDPDPDAGHFCAEGRLPLSALGVQVHGLGPLPQPAPADAAQALHRASEPAPFGHRSRTLLDPQVRDTGQVDADALTLHWSPGTLAHLQADAARALGLHAVQARLHKLLVYGPGQFFKPHQDTEKHRGMVATLVLVWPSAHIGGELRVQHDNEVARFASQHLRADALRWFAFYADCRHEVLPVDEGWRIVLTFDLVLAPAAAAPPPPAHPALLDALRATFAPEGGPRLQPWVLLLDHEYTERSLRWPLLKGRDRPRVAALRAAAQAQGLTVHLALAQIHELWSATESHAGGSRRSGRSAGTPEPDELLDADMHLDTWVDADDQPLRRDALPVPPGEAESFTKTDSAFLVNEEYEGYMGNYGETLDHWYRRAALVLQTPLAAEAGRYVTDFDAALADARALARAGRGDELAARLQAARAALDHGVRTRGRQVLQAYAELAAALPDAGQARALCLGFEWSGFEPGDAPALALLAGRWGAVWTVALVQAWARPEGAWRRLQWLTPGPDHPSAPWPQPLPAFVQAGQAAQWPPEVQATVRAQCLALQQEADAAVAQQPPAQRRASAQRRLQALCELAQALQGAPQGVPQSAEQSAEQSAPSPPPPDSALLDALLRHVLASPLAHPLRGLRPLVQALPTSPVAPPSAQALRRAVVQALQQALAQPERPPEDRRLEGIAWTCRCADCRPAIAWAEAPEPAPLALALAEARRQHVQQQLQAADAPLSFQLLKQGSPYKLVVHKPADLPARRLAERRAWADDLAALGGGA